MSFVTITDEQKKKDLVKNIVSREAEIYSYQTNIDNYTSLLQILPVEWPEELLQYKGMNIGAVPAENIYEVSDLIFAERISELLKSEIIEQNKSKHIYNALIAQIDVEEFQTIYSEISE